MDPEHFPGHEADKTRVDRLQELADSLERAHAAVLASDLRQITQQTARQLELCAQLRQLSRDAVQTPTSWLPGGLSSPVRPSNHAFGEELAEVAGRVAQLNRQYEALLRRARRTVDIFCRVLTNSALTYPLPRPETARFGAGFQE
jgi:hypothetical protein